VKDPAPYNGHTDMRKNSRKAEVTKGTTVLNEEKVLKIQILRFWTLSIVLFISKTSSCLYFKTQCFGDWLYLCLQVKPTQFGPLDRVSLYLRTPVAAPR
jgi:hypothetical protein